MSEGQAGAGAYDATVAVTPQEPPTSEAKLRAAVDYYERELALLDGAEERAEAKRVKLRQNADAVDDELANIEEERARLQNNLDEARARLERGVDVSEVKL